MLPLDVTPAQQRRHDELARRLTTEQRARLIDDLWRTGRQLAEAGVRDRPPGASEPLVRWLLTELLYGAAVAERLYGPRPAR